MDNLYSYVNSLVMYNASRQNTILLRISEILNDVEEGTYGDRSVGRDAEHDRGSVLRQINDEIHRLLEIATTYGFTENLWTSYVAFLLATDENPFSILCEMVGAAEDASANIIVKKDMDCFYHIFNYDFSSVESTIGTDCFSLLCDYKSMHKDANTYNISVSGKVRELRGELEKASSGEDFFSIVTGFYQRYGVGKFGLNKAFRLIGEGETSIEAITHTSDVTLEHLVGYESQKQILIENTEAFVAGRPANNCLLYGDAGTGKSTCVKALLNRYYDRGLRLIELYRHQFRELSSVIAQVKNRNYKFIIYMDDLSFEEFETDYKYLKAVIEGGMEVRPDNVLIYATSNRRHLIRETWSDRSDTDDEVHHSDTMQEKLSLAARFGVSILFDKPSKKLYDEIVLTLAHGAGIDMDQNELLAQANVWSLRNGGYSGRTAEYFIVHLLSTGKSRNC
ncbi:MAG: ATP-binding protein [Eubacterium sp.]|nr:ATP-binding protein [Eubacterium sp.]